jgi:hypothetical protein
VDTFIIEFLDFFVLALSDYFLNSCLINQVNTIRFRKEVQMGEIIISIAVGGGMLAVGLIIRLVLAKNWKQFGNSSESQEN